MEKSEVLALAERLHMEPMIVATDVRECYGELVAVHSYQTGFALDTDELVPELEELFNWNTGRVILLRMDGALKGYRYELYTPSSWFEKED